MILTVTALDFRNSTRSKSLLFRRTRPGTFTFLEFLMKKLAIYFMTIFQSIMASENSTAMCTEALGEGPTHILYERERQKESLMPSRVGN